MRFPPSLLLFLALPALSFGQLAAPNAQGVAMGHLHLNSTDLDASRRFWIDFLGGTVAKKGSLELFKFPGVLVAVRKVASVTGGTDGSAVNHLGFTVTDLDAMLAKSEKMGYAIVKRMPDTRQAFIMGPDNTKVELTEDKAQGMPVRHHHVHFFNAQVLETQAWYAKMFGAKPGRRGKFEAADLPGVNLSFAVSETPVVPTKGRSVDHIGFEIRNLKEFVKELEAKGVKFDIPYREVPALGLKIAFFTDPWGTYVELTEGLDGV